MQVRSLSVALPVDGGGGGCQWLKITGAYL